MANQLLRHPSPTGTRFTGRTPPNQRLVNKQGADFEQSGDLPYWQTPVDRPQYLRCKAVLTQVHPIKKYILYIT